MNIETVSSPLKRSGDFLSRFAHEMGDRLPHPNGIASEDVALQGVLKEFENRFAIADILEETDSNDEGMQAEETARSMSEAGLADEETTLELRLILPEKPLRNPDFIVNMVDKMNAVNEILAKEHGVDAVSNTHPIMPTYEPGEKIDRRSVWQSIGDELDGFSHQMKVDSTSRKIAVLAITESSYARHLLGEQILMDEDASGGSLMVLRHVGKTPNENLLLPSDSHRPLSLRQEASSHQVQVG
jgi:hypothetical protein